MRATPFGIFGLKYGLGILAFCAAANASAQTLSPASDALSLARAPFVREPEHDVPVPPIRLGRLALSGDAQVYTHAWTYPSLERAEGSESRFTFHAMPVEQADRPRWEVFGIYVLQETYDRKREKELRREQGGDRTFMHLPPSVNLHQQKYMIGGSLKF